MLGLAARADLGIIGGRIRCGTLCTRGFLDSHAARLSAVEGALWGGKSPHLSCQLYPRSYLLKRRRVLTLCDYPPYNTQPSQIPTRLVRPVRPRFI